MRLPDYIGGLAAVCTTFAFVPQILKIRRQGGGDLSYPMLGVYLIGIVLWLVYGLMLHAAAVINTIFVEKVSAVVDARSGS